MLNLHDVLNLHNLRFERSRRRGHPTARKTVAVGPEPYGTRLAHLSGVLRESEEGKTPGRVPLRSTVVLGAEAAVAWLVRRAERAQAFAYQSLRVGKLAGLCLDLGLEIAATYEG